MKNLFFLMMAIMLINVSFAGELGEDQKGDCVNSPQNSRNQTVVVDESDTTKTIEKGKNAASQRD
ncbi:MAG: hypothetical protein K9K67_03070 [Bacteriovoracaceae bacterium]|nr:hypothetical protein [Bacteriovoracaceae bacterium]